MVENSKAVALERLPIDQRIYLEDYSPLAILKTYYRHRELGWEEYGYVDSGKPNAVIIQPTKDENQAFSHPTTIGFVKKLKEHYDLVLRVAHSETDAYRSISAVPSPELVIISGHGLPGMLSFSASKKEVKKAREESILDTKDDEFAHYINHAAEDATIFLYACHGKKLTDFVKKHSGNRRVIGSKTSFATEDLEILSYYPLDIRIITHTKIPFINREFSRDRTYIL
ncbi:hypothetical protein GOV10_03300 [Candidatus Woesearchaeota archaeon]|nr:hypothetical protein [Candidatus Woesearchaeota archaeon]